ncbi:MAG: hypothetical protein ACE5NG_21010 [bacterium]
MNFDDLKLEQVVLQLNYDSGYRYWDKCGETIIEIQKAFPEWTWREIRRDGTVLENQKTEHMSLLFSWDTIRLIQHEVENLNQFRNYCGEIPRIITKCLSIEKYQRVGNRFWYIYKVQDIESGQKEITRAKLLEIPAEKIKLFGDRIKAKSFTIVFEKNDLDIRLFVDVFKRADVPQNLVVDEEFHPEHMIRFDVDIHTDKEVNVEAFDCREFVQKNKNLIANNLAKFF